MRLMRRYDYLLRKKPVTVMDVTAGSLQEASEQQTGRAHSFILKCRGRSIASNDNTVILAALDADMKTRLLDALSNMMGCVVMPKASLAESTIGISLSLAQGGGSHSPDKVIPHDQDSSSTKLILKSTDSVTVTQDGSHRSPTYPDSRINNDVGQFRTSHVGENSTTLKGLLGEFCSLVYVRSRFALFLVYIVDCCITIALGIYLQYLCFLGKIQERLTSTQDDNTHSRRGNFQGSRERKNVSDRMTLALKNVKQDIFPEVDIQDEMKTKELHGAVFESISETTGNDQVSDLECQRISMTSQSFTSVNVEVVKILTPGKSTRKYLFLKDLFSVSTATVAANVVRAKLLDFEADYDSIASGKTVTDDNEDLSLPDGEYTLEEIGQYVQQCELRNPESIIEVVNIVVIVTLEDTGYHRRMSCPLVSWNFEIANQVGWHCPCLEVVWECTPTRNRHYI